MTREEAIKELALHLTQWIKHEIEDTFKAHLKDAEERTTEVYEYDDFQYAYFLGKAKAYDEVIRRLGGDTEQFVKHFDLLKEYQSLQKVVRCKDCRWWNSETKGCNRNPSVEAWYETDFCKYGERRNNE